MLSMYRVRIAAVFTTVFLSPLFASAQAAAPALNPSGCDELFALPKSTIAGNNGGVMTPEVCAAYKELMTRYEPGDDSKNCIKNVEVVGITSLNADFAVRLNNLLKAGDAAVGRFKINSAYRNDCAQGSANPNATAKGFVSMHTKGLAVDLIYPGGGTKLDCSSTGYKWIIDNAKTKGIGQYSQLHTYVDGECNHIEDAKGVSGIGPGGGSPSPQRSPFSNMGQLSQGLGQFFSPPPPNPAAQAMAQQALPQQNYFPPSTPSYTSPSPVSNTPSPIASPNTVVTSNPGTSGSINTNANNTSASDLINALAYPSSTPAASTGTGTVVALNNAIAGNPVPLTGDSQPFVNPNSPLTQANTLTPKNGGTFTSPDMNQNSVPAYAPGYSSTFGILESLKQTLLLILRWMAPFGGSLQNPLPANTAAAVLR